MSDLRKPRATACLASSLIQHQRERSLSLSSRVKWRSAWTPQSRTQARRSKRDSAKSHRWWAAADGAQPSAIKAHSTLEPARLLDPQVNVHRLNGGTARTLAQVVEPCHQNRL